MECQIDSLVEKDIIHKLQKEAQLQNQFEGMVKDIQALVQHRNQLEKSYSNLDDQTQAQMQENKRLKLVVEMARQNAIKGFIAQKYKEKSIQLQEQYCLTLQDHAQVLQQLVRYRSRLETREEEIEFLNDDLQQSCQKNYWLKVKVAELQKQVRDTQLTRTKKSEQLQETLEQQETVVQWVDELRENNRVLERRMVELADELAQKRTSLNSDYDQINQLQQELWSFDKRSRKRQSLEKLRKQDSVGAK